MSLADRLDMQHAMMTCLLHNRLFWAPLGAEIQEVMDIGTGTGIWAIEMAEMVRILQCFRFLLISVRTVPKRPSGRHRSKPDTTRLDSAKLQIRD